MKLNVEFEFCASHTLKELSTEAGQLHGHNYVFYVEVDGVVNPETGVIIDFEALDRLVEERIIRLVDHRHLNQFIELPTTEIMLAWFWRLLAPVLPLTRLRIYETRRYYAEYTGEPVEVRYAEGYEGPSAL